MKNIFLFLFLAFIQYSYAQTPVFQDTKGDLSVSNSGTLNYTLPIAVPPGVKGQIPNITLSYSSGNNNGVAGYGWNITGLSSINEVGKRLDLDGKVEAINPNAGYAEHQYALDGKRLILKKISTISPFKKLVEYETEEYSNLKIEMFLETCASHPCFISPQTFKVTAPDGTINYFDNYYDKIYLGTTKDTDGNAVYYDYHGDGLTGFEKSNGNILSILWGNFKKSGLNGEMKFYYKDRSRIEYSGTSNQGIIADKILDRIEVYSQGTLYRKYVLTHETIQNNYQRLTQVQEFNGAGEAANPVVFSYSDTPNTISNLGYFKSTTENEFKNIQLSGDFDGNGESDFIANNKLYLNAISSDNTWTPTDMPSSFDASKSVVVKTKKEFKKLAENQVIARVGFTTIFGEETVYIDLYNKNKLMSRLTYLEKNNPELISLKTRHKSKLYAGDFNGDGLSEIIYKATPLNGNPASYFYFNIEEVYHEDHWKIPYNCRQIEGLTLGDNSYILDFNGDGKDDILNLDYSTKRITIYNLPVDEGDSRKTIARSNYSINLPELIKEQESISLIVPAFGVPPWKEVTNVVYDQYQQMVWGDFNGDGKIELLIPEKRGSYKWFLYSSNSDFGYTRTEYPNLINYDPVFAGTITKSQLKTNQYQAADMDKDGKSDLVVVNNRSICVDLAVGRCDRDGTGSVTIYNNIGYQKNTQSNLLLPTFDLANPIKFELENDTPYDQTYFFSGEFKTNAYTDASNIVFIEGKQIWKAKYNKDFSKDLRISAITEAGGAIKTEVTYSPMVPSEANDGYGNENDFYYSANEEIYPNAEVQKTPSSQLVSQLKITGAGQTKKQDFKYYGLTLNSHGYGYFGFKKMARSSFYTDTEQNRIWNVTETKPGFLGKVVKEWTYKTNDHSLFHTSPTIETSNNNLLSLTEYSYNNGVKLPTPIVNQREKIKKIFLDKTTKKDFLTGVISTSTIAYDAFFNPIKTITSNGVGTKTTDLVYFNNPTGIEKDYILGRLLQKNESITAYGDTRTSEEKYTYTNNLLTKKQTKAHNTDYITEDNTFDTFRNLTQKTISAPGVSYRSTTYEYDSTQRFVTKETDPDNFVSLFEYDIFGRPTKETNHLGIISQNVYDNWGKPIQNIVTGSSASPVTENFAYTKNTDGSVTLTNTNPDTGEESSKQLDAFGREIKVTTKGFAAGSKISKVTEYDFLGRKTRESEAFFDYFDGLNNPVTPTKWNSFAYDDLSRPISQTFFTGRKITLSYSGLSATTTDDTKTTTTTVDANGNKVTVKDNTETINYEYYANNALKNTKYGSHTIATGIDGWGRKTSLLDPSVSSKPYTYAYNNYGEMTTETTPTGTNTYEYSPTGRLLSKKSTGTNTNNSLTYSYDAKGLVTKQTGVSNKKNFTQDFVYNSFYQLISQTETTPNLITTNTFTYDTQGRKLTETTNAKLATNANINNGSPTVAYGYNAYNGMLDQIKDQKTAKVLWQLNGANEQLQATGILLGNGMTTTNIYDTANYLTSIVTKSASNTALDLSYNFDAKRGVLYNRENKSFGWKETFTYDTLDRLLTWQDPTGTKSNSYDNFSRITQNDQVGAYAYNETTRYKKSEITLNTAGNNYYKSRQTQEVSYDINQNPIKITETGKTTLDFVYDAEGNRTETIFTNKRDKTKTIFYSSDNGVEVEIIPAKGKIPMKYNFITYLAGDPYSAPIVYRKASTGSTGTPTPNTEGFYYLHRDYLGSVLAISNSAGVTIERRHFDAWGNLAKLEINGKTETNTNLMLTQRGYTGHEHFYEQGIIHMNGRIYDPKIRMFLSPDINLLDNANSQHFNRFSYALNNPLVYKDPTGNTVLPYYTPPSYSIPSYSTPSYSIPSYSIPSYNYQMPNINFNNPFTIPSSLTSGYGSLDNLFNYSVPMYDFKGELQASIAKNNAQLAQSYTNSLNIFYNIPSSSISGSAFYNQGYNSDMMGSACIG